MLNDVVSRALIWLLVIAFALLVFFMIITRKPSKNKAEKANKAEKVSKVKREPKPKKEKPVKEKRIKREKKKKVETETVTPVQNEEIQGPSPDYVSPLIIDRTKYEIALQEKLEREKQEKLNRQAMETARLEMLKNKEFQSHAGFINTLQRFSKKETLEKQLENDGKVDRELLDTYLNEKGSTISSEFANMSPELKAVILSDLMKRKY